MRVSILTIFPDFFPPALAEGMIRAAREKGRLAVDVVGLRDFTEDAHRTTDDYPFGGGVGMIMKTWRERFNFAGARKETAEAIKGYLFKRCFQFNLYASHSPVKGREKKRKPGETI